MEAQLNMFAEVEEGMVERLIALLKRKGGWVHAGEVLTEWGLEDTEDWRRYVRKLAQGSGPEVISGQRGYKWIGYGNAAEIDHAASGLESQGKKMIERGLAIRRRAHAIFG